MADSDTEHSRSPKRRRIESYDGTPRYSSPDELAGTPNQNGYSDPRSATFRRDPQEHRDRSYPGSSVDRESPDELDHTAPIAPESESYESEDDDRDGSATPVPRVRTPVPEKQEAVFVPYRLRAVLRGHKRGVAAVRFSPDGRMIASCCE